jgi:Concanavalin A-like lectin/glucanases superfamily
MKKLLFVAPLVALAILVGSLSGQTEGPFPLSAFGGRPTSASSSTLVGQWNLCGDTSSGSGCAPTASTVVYDSSGNGNNGAWNGTQSGTSDWYSAATNLLPYGGHFQGTNDYVSVPDAGVLHVASAFTVSFWLDLAGGGTYNATVTKTSGGTACPFDSWITSGGAGYFYVGNGTSYTLLNFSISTGSWDYVDYVYDGSNITVYVNGSVVAGPTSAGMSLADCGTPLRVGSRNDNATFLDGNLNYVQLYNVALTSGQISTLYSMQAFLVDPTRRDPRERALASLK